VHPDAQLRLLDLRPLRLPAQGHLDPCSPDGSYHMLSAEHIFNDYQFSTDGQIQVPA
jgi:hypothetical protein